MTRFDLFDAILEKIYESDDATFQFKYTTRWGVTSTVTLHRGTPLWMDFDGDEPLLLEDCSNDLLIVVGKHFNVI